MKLIFWAIKVTKMSLEYKVPRLLWESFESVLLAQSKRYICELAKRLNVSEKELLKRVLPSSDSLKVIIQDTQAETNQCKAYVQNDKITSYCRKPTVYGCEFCAFHRNKRMTVVKDTNPVSIQKVKDMNTNVSLWLNGDDIINSSSTVVGKVNKSKNKIKLFVIEN